ncbi:MAG TPA: glycosyltransferase [Candidatus Dormibacteraeota bacterium]|nr:glycosyltransferase [Candidatus Dormibacteraeota bacterium]
MVIPLHRDNPAFRKCLAGCLALEHPSFEVIVVSDGPVDLPPRTRLLLTGSHTNTGPGEKRDVGMHQAAGSFLAFIDDDAIPRHDWLARAADLLADESLGAVAGPGVTPPDSPWRERMGGSFYESWLGSGPYRYRFRPGKPRYVDDYPAYNLIVRKTAAEHVKGWRTGFYGGEDTVICLALVRAGWLIRYDPELVVFHQRRPVIRKHLAQVGNVGLHRGYFVKAYPATSLRPSYFLPSLGTVALAGLLATSAFSGIARRLLVGALAAYFVAGVTIGLAESDEPPLALALPVVAFLSHVTYGLQFLRGLLTRRLER